LFLNVDKLEVALVLVVQELNHVFELEVAQTAHDFHHVFEAAQVDLFPGDLHLRLELLELRNKFFARRLELFLDLGECFKCLFLVAFS